MAILGLLCMFLCELQTISFSSLFAKSNFQKNSCFCNNWCVFLFVDLLTFILLLRNDPKRLHADESSDISTTFLILTSQTKDHTNRDRETDQEQNYIDKHILPYCWDIQITVLSEAGKEGVNIRPVNADLFALNYHSWPKMKAPNGPLTKVVAHPWVNRYL